VNATETAAAVRAGTTSARAVVDATLARIAVENPDLNAFTSSAPKRSTPQLQPAPILVRSRASRLRQRICSTSRASSRARARRSLPAIRRQSQTLMQSSLWNGAAQSWSA
jgi:Asp-tRNA(Asn)/Glu-tRNA(Gln) amidotransferase A subunit family amidase